MNAREVKASSLGFSEGEGEADGVSSQPANKGPVLLFYDLRQRQVGSGIPRQVSGEFGPYHRHRHLSPSVIKRASQFTLVHVGLKSSLAALSVDVACVRAKPPKWLLNDATCRVGSPTPMVQINPDRQEGFVPIESTDFQARTHRWCR